MLFEYGILYLELRQHRTKTMLCALPCIRLHLFRHFCTKLLEIRRYSCVVLDNLTKKLTARLHDNLCAVLPKKERRTVIMTGILFICHGSTAGSRELAALVGQNGANRSNKGSRVLRFYYEWGT